MEQYVMTTWTIRMPLLSVHNLDSLLMVRLFAQNVYHQLYHVNIFTTFSLNHVCSHILQVLLYCNRLIRLIM